MPNTLCLIPARGGSKRIPRKNVLPLAGKPLLAYTIDTALEAGVFADVVISSDDEEILALSQSRGAAIDRRPEHLSGDTIRMVEVVEEFLRRPENHGKYDNVAAMLPTCPFRLADDVRGAFQLFSETPEAFLLSVSEYEFPPQLALEFGTDCQRVTMREPEMYDFSTRSQNQSKCYHPNGAIYLASVANFLRTQTFFCEPLLGYAMPPERSFDIDYPYQFQIAESMMRLRGEQGGIAH